MATANQGKKYKVIGTRPIRHDGVDKVTGRAKYGADINLTGMLHGAVLRSPHAHARILSIDTSKAEALPGVHAVVTSKDLPDVEHKVSALGEAFVDVAYLTLNVLARDKVLYKGHQIAGVVADDIHIADEAAKLIEVEYEVLKPVLTTPEAIKKDAPILIEDLKTQTIAGALDSGPTNIAQHFQHETGDVEKGFAEASVVIEREFDTATVHQGYIEPHVVTGLWNRDGQITIWTSTQGTFSVRQQMADLLKIPASRIKVIPMEIGGGFGGKISVYMDPLAVLLSKKTGQPVKMVMDRASVFEATGPTAGAHFRIKMGADDKGKLIAAEADLYYEAGAYPGAFVFAACMTVYACYDIKNGKVDGFDVVVNKPRSNAYRAPGATTAAFGVETVLDEIAEKLGMDPAEIRLLNAAKEGTARIDGPSYARIGMVETVEAIKESEHFQTPLEGPNKGRGIASGFWFNAGLKSAVTASVNFDGRVAMLEGSTDIGGSRAGIAMQLAETLGIEAEDVIPTVVDTDSIGYTDVTGGSRVTYATGWAAYEAGMDIQRQMIKRAAEIWGVDEKQVSYEDGTIIGPDDHKMTFQEMAAHTESSGDSIVGRGTSSHEEPGGAFATHVVDVEVDPDTGKVTILRYTAAQDCGTAIHPAYVEGQIQGGVVQGIGWALNEEYYYNEDGVMENSSFLDYRIPTCLDVPMIEPIIVEVPNPGHPFGVRGVGEVPIVPPPAAIANAIYRATGVRMTVLPMSPPKLMHEMLNK
jgi:xanthine dehydrogenase molybdenum-binding subunit